MSSDSRLKGRLGARRSYTIPMQLNYPFMFCYPNFTFPVSSMGAKSVFNDLHMGSDIFVGSLLHLILGKLIASFICNQTKK